MRAGLFIVMTTTELNERSLLDALYSEMAGQMERSAEAEATVIRLVRKRICGESTRLTPKPAA